MVAYATSVFENIRARPVVPVEPQSLRKLRSRYGDAVMRSQCRPSRRLGGTRDAREGFTSMRAYIVVDVERTRDIGRRICVSLLESSKKGREVRVVDCSRT
jgi:hypothetical protein